MRKIALLTPLFLSWRRSEAFLSPAIVQRRPNLLVNVEGRCRLDRIPSFVGLQQSNVDNNKNSDSDGEKNTRAFLDPVLSDPSRSLKYSALMTVCGAILGPFLDAYHSAFSVLQYDEPIKAILWGTAEQPALTTAWWVPELFGLAGFIIGWLYILLDATLETNNDNPSQRLRPSPPKILYCISLFTLQYWLSGVLYGQLHLDRESILSIMSTVAFTGFLVFDRTKSGFLTSLATAVGGPLIEVGLISTLQGYGGYHYSDPGETGFFPLWIVPVYFLGGPAVGNLGRGFWNWLSASSNTVGGGSSSSRPCQACNDSRAVGCPNCEAQGYYVSYGQSVKCTCCKGRGLVMCRECFANYDEDPNDIVAIREKMSKLPD